MDRIKLWPHVTIIAILCAVLGGVAAELWLTHKQPAEESSALPSAARIERVDGEVGLNRNLDNNSNNQWTETTPNTPVSVGDRIYTRDKARTSIAFTGRNFARLNDHSALDVLSLSDKRTQLALRDGSAVFNVGSLASGELFEVATPCGAVDLERPGLYQIGINDDGSTVASVLSGQAQVVGLGGTGEIDRGERLALCDQTGSNAVLSQIDPTEASSLVDDYYSYQYPKTYDGRYRNYDAYLNDPYYYDPYQRDVSYKYVTDEIPGVEDLDDYGDWQDVSGYGYCWHPRVDAGWVPYQQGYWYADEPYGMTWVSSEPWGYAPYHYGRWAYVTNQWFWIPERVHTRPAYAPALVAFIPLTQTNQVGWVPLGPGDPYVATYYDANWHPHYLNRTTAVQERVVNLNVPGAVTVVERQDFNRVINHNMIVRVNQQEIARSRPVLDPLAVDELRQAALQNREARRRIEVPPSVAQRLDSTRVITSTAPAVPPFRNNLAQRLHVEPVSENQRQARLQFRDNRQATVAQPGNAPRSTATTQAPGQVINPAEIDQERSRQIAVLKTEADKGNRVARRQMQVLQRQQAQSAAQPNVVRQPSVTPQPGNAAQVENERTQQRAQGERVGQQQIRAQRDAERQQAIAAQQQQRAITQQQGQARRQASQQVLRQQTQPQIRMRPESQPARIQQQQERRQVIQQNPKPQVQVQQPHPQARPEAGRAQVQQQTPKPQPQPKVVQPAPQPKVERPAGNGKHP